MAQIIATRSGAQPGRGRSAVGDLLTVLTWVGGTGSATARAHPTGSPARGVSGPVTIGSTRGTSSYVPVPRRRQPISGPARRF